MLPSSSAATQSEAVGQATASTPPRLLNDQVDRGAEGSNEPSSPEIPSPVSTEARHSERDWHQIPYSESGRDRTTCWAGASGVTMMARPASPSTAAQKPRLGHEMPNSELSPPASVGVLVHGAAFTLV